MRHGSTVLVLMLILAAGVLAQVPAIPSPTFQSRTDIVSVTATVENRDGSFADGLDATDFQVFENGEPQTIAVFDAGTIPVDVVVLIDNSASMTAWLPAVQHAAATLVRALGPSDRAGVVTFGGRMMQRTPITGDQRQLLGAINGITASGETALYDAVYLVLRTMATRAEPTRRQAVVVLSDGDDTRSLLSYDVMLQAAREVGVAVYTIALRRPETRPDGRTTRIDYELRTLSSDTGGRFLVATEDRGLDPMYASIAAELGHQYSIGYTSTHSREVNGVAWISVLVSRRDVSVRARRAYLSGR